MLSINPVQEGSRRAEREVTEVLPQTHWIVPYGGEIQPPNPSTSPNPSLSQQAAVSNAAKHHPSFGIWGCSQLGGGRHRTHPSPREQDPSASAHHPTSRCPSQASCSRPGPTVGFLSPRGGGRGSSAPQVENVAPPYPPAVCRARGPTQRSRNNGGNPKIAAKPRQRARGEARAPSGAGTGWSRGVPQPRSWLQGCWEGGDGVGIAGTVARTGLGGSIN